MTIVHSAGPSDQAALENPINIEDMYAWLGARYGTPGNFQFTSIERSWELGQMAPCVTQTLLKDTFGMPGNTDNLGQPTNGTGIALTGVPLRDTTYDQAGYFSLSMRYKFRLVGSGVFPLGIKLPGPGGILKGRYGNPPTGGKPDPNGFSARLMVRRNRAFPEQFGDLVGYVYTPQLTGAGTIGLDRQTRTQIHWGTWYDVEQVIVHNSLQDELVPNADGMHTIRVNDAAVYQKLDEVWRLKRLAKTNRIVWDCFSGGNEAMFKMPSTVKVQFKNFVIEAT